MDGIIPDVKSLRIPVKYLANLLTAGNEAPVTSALERHARHASIQTRRGRAWPSGTRVAQRPEPHAAQVEDMYQTMAIANYEDRFVCVIA